MKKNVKVVLVAAIVVLILGISAFIYLNNKEKYNVTDDSLKFKAEYEALNGTVNENNNKEYMKVELEEHNPMKYTTYAEIFELLESGSGVIYFGFPECPWCRNLVTVLSDSAIEAGIDTIYYFNNLADRDTKEIQTKNKKDKVVTTKEGTADYLKLIGILKDHLSDYTLTNSKGEKINAGNKRIYFPTVVFVKDGEILGAEQSLSEYAERVEGDPYQPMITLEKEALAEIFNNYYKEILKK